LRLRSYHTQVLSLATQNRSDGSSPYSCATLARVLGGHRY
jgi:hypothetical protein